MQYSQLGNTDLRISEVAFGGVEIGMPYGLNSSQTRQMLGKKEAINLLHYALDKGINFFDTARLYGESENIMGDAFHGNRDQVILASKCRHLRNRDGSLPPRSDLKQIVEKSIRDSLKSLQTDYIDVFMVHYADLEILEMEELYTIFADLQKAGFIRYPGVSVYEEQETKRALDKGFWKVIQLPFNLMDQKHSLHFKQAQEQGVGIVARSVLMRGLLADRSLQLHPALKSVQDHILKYRQLLNTEIATLPALAMKFAASTAEISAVLVGLDKTEFVDQAVEIFNGKYLTPEQLALANSLNYPDQEFLNLAQWDKNGWL